MLNRRRTLTSLGTAAIATDTQGSLAKAWTDVTKAGVKRIQSSDIAV